MSARLLVVATQRCPARAHALTPATLVVWAALALGVACTSEPVAEPSAVWSEAFDASKVGALSGVWGVAPDDVWTVGGTTNQGQIHHFDGTSWSPVAVPDGTPLLSWVYGFATDDVWVVGTKGVALHWDGKAWAKVDTGTTADLWGVWGPNKDDLWAVGGTVGAGVPVILRKQGGAAFQALTLDPAENTRDATAIFKVWGIDGLVFAVGEGGLVLQWSGTAWKAVSAGAKANDDFVSLWGTSGSHIVAVGGRAQARVATWDGSQWTTVAPAGTPGLNAVYMTTPGTAVVGGILGVAGAFDVGKAAFSQEETGVSETVHGIWCDGAGTCYAVGGVFSEPQRGLALARRLQ